ncbi:MAG: hypothetical protein R2911_09970 [Caldilineaceae bacterium]
MKSYDELTWPGKRRRLYRLAQDALAQYDLEVSRLVPLGYDTNMMYCAYAADGANMRCGWLTACGARSATPSLK